MASVNKMVPESMKTGFISIDSYVDKCFKGRVFYPSFDGETKFNNAMQMLAAIGEAVSSLGYTDEYCQMRSFAPVSETTAQSEKCDPPAQSPRGEKATFRLKIIFMQNATWQGTLLWEEGSEEQSFRSVLEMLYLMDSALSK